MEMNIDFDVKNLTKKIDDIFEAATVECGNVWLNATKQILINKDAIDTGEYLNSIHFTVEKDKNTYVLTGLDAVNYGIYIEKGTVKHWVPFYRNDDVSQPILADWGHRVLGLSEEEMLKMGGMKVKNTGTHAFEIGLQHLKLVCENIFAEKFKDLM